MLGCGKFLSVGDEFVVQQVVELLRARTLNRCGEQHNINMLQIFSATFVPNIVKFGQHLAKLFPK